jgi:hypothetical protein
MLESQIDQALRRATLRNDLKVRQEQEEGRRTFAADQSLPNPGTTYLQHAQSDADIPRGRFTAYERSSVTGATPNPASLYPAGPAWSADPGSQLLEPPLGFDNPALEVASIVSTPQAPDPTSDAPSTPLGQRDVGSLSSQPNPATVDPSVPSDVERRVGLGPFSGDPSSVLAGPRDTSRVVGSPVPYRRF